MLKEKQTRKSAHSGFVTALLGLATVLAVYVYWDYQDYNPTTDDAYIKANIVNIAPQISGPIRAVFVHDNQYVTVGTPLFAIDNRPYQISHNQAAAHLETIEHQVHAADNIIAAKQAEVEALFAKMTEAQQFAARILPLVKTNQISRSEGDVARENYNFARAEYESASQNLKALILKTGVRNNHNPDIRQAHAILDRANLDLQHTIITAPISGTITHMDIRPGSIVQAGETIFSIVEQRVWWVEANFKETQLGHIHQGQMAKIKLDMYPNHIFHGLVESISPGSGDAFSIFPDENGAGNWVKVTRRIPVRIAIKDPDPYHPLKVGSSGKVRVYTRVS